MTQFSDNKNKQTLMSQSHCHIDIDYKHNGIRLITSSSKLSSEAKSYSTSPIKFDQILWDARPQNNNTLSTIRLIGVAYISVYSTKPQYI